MDAIKALLSSYSTEAGEAGGQQASVSDRVVGDNVVNHLDDEVGVYDNMLDSADAAGEVASEMDSIADRAEALVDSDDAAVQDVSVESLHREFGIVARAYKVNLNTDSFESAGTHKGRLQGLARDARLAADVARQVRADVLDFSPEGKLMEFLRRDKTKLSNATKDLDEAIHELTPIASKLKEGGVVLKHDGHRRFLTVSGAEVPDVMVAVENQTKTLEKAHHEAVAGLAEALAAAKKLLGSGVKAGISELMSGKHFHGLESVGTSKGVLLGNNSITATNKPGKITGLSVPVFKRTNEHSVSKMGLAKGAGVLAWGFFIGALQGGAIRASGAERTATAVERTQQGMAVHNAMKSYDDHVNSSKKKSTATYDELVKIANLVKGYDRFTHDRMNLDEFDAAIKAAKANTDTLSSEEKSDLKSVCAALEEAAARIVRLEGCVYEQSLYTTTMTASIIKAVVSKLGE